MADVAARRGSASIRRSLSAAAGAPVVVLDPRRGTNVDELRDVVVATASAPAPVALHIEAPPDDDLAVEDARFAWITAAAAEAPIPAAPDGPGRIGWTPWPPPPSLGPLLFLTVMWIVFQVTTTVAAPLQEMLDAVVTGPVSEAAQRLLDAVGLGSTWAAGFVVDGLIAGVGMLLTFVPLMALMFVLLALLEDSGYMARAAVVTDSLMRRIGLPGRAFLPLVVGFGCNVRPSPAPGSCPTCDIGC